MGRNPRTGGVCRGVPYNQGAFAPASSLCLHVQETTAGSFVPLYAFNLRDTNCSTADFSRIQSLRCCVTQSGELSCPHYISLPSSRGVLMSSSPLSFSLSPFPEETEMFGPTNPTEAVGSISMRMRREGNFPKELYSVLKMNQEMPPCLSFLLAEQSSLLSTSWDAQPHRIPCSHWYDHNPSIQHSLTALSKQFPEHGAWGWGRGAGDRTVRTWAPLRIAVPRPFSIMQSLCGSWLSHPQHHAWGQPNAVMPGNQKQANK